MKPLQNILTINTVNLWNTETDRKIAVIFVVDVVGYSKSYGKR